MEDYLAMSQRLLDAGVRKVVWVAPPRPDLPYDEPMATQLHDPDRFARFRELLRRARRRRIRGTGGGRRPGDVAGRPSRNRPSETTGCTGRRGGARDLAERYLAPVVLAEALVAP